MFVWCMAYLTLTTTAPQYQLSQSVLHEFGAREAVPIMRLDYLPPNAGRVAQRMRTKAMIGAPTFVSEDGAAIAVWSGTVDKLDVRTGALLTENDKYRIFVRDSGAVTFNVSQERYIEGRALGGRMLRPLVLLDKYRTLCVNGAASVWDSDMLAETELILTVIDDRVRGRNPNKLRRIAMPYSIGALNFIVAAHDDWFTLRIGLGEPARYIDVNANTLETRRSRPPTLAGYPWDTVKAGLGEESGVIVKAGSRWNDRSFYLATTRIPDETGNHWRSFVWDGSKLQGTEPWLVLGASTNGKHAWLMNRDSGSSWLISK